MGPTTIWQRFGAARHWGWLVLFSSSATLICCALPIVLVALGLGAVSASLFANLPFLVTLAQHKLWLFISTGCLLLLSGWLLYRSGRSCPTDPKLAMQCAIADRWNRRFWWGSVVVWTIGLAAAYLTLPIWQLLMKG